MDMTAKLRVRRAMDELRHAEAGESRAALALDFGRCLIARSAGADDPAAYAAGRWGSESRPARLLKAAVGASSADDLRTELDDLRAAWFAGVVEQAIAGALVLARLVSFNVPTLAPNADATGYWTSEGKPIPISKMTVQGTALPARKVAAILVASNEALKDPRGEIGLIGDLQRACAAALDSAFVGDQAGSDSLPAGILEGITPEVSTGTPEGDAAAAIEGFAGDLSSAAWITDPHTAAALALYGGTAFQNAGATGGSVLGIPLISSRSSPRDSSGGQLVLLDQSALALALEGISIGLSRNGTVLMSDAPESDAPPTPVSLFQNDLTGYKAILRCNWRLVRSGAVSAVAGAVYGAS